MTCPTCGSKLEVADEDIGHTVQCGSCQQTFTAEDPGRKRNDGAARDPDEDDRRPSSRRGGDRERDRDDDYDRPRRSSRDRDDYDRDDDYRPRRSRYRDDDEAYERRYGPAQQTGMGITSMILGILSIPTIFCYGFGIILGILAIIFGILSLKTAGRGMGIAGICTAIFAFLIFGALILFYVFALAARGGGGNF
jgi:predicted Zn finger-like uncharacterized protein